MNVTLPGNPKALTIPQDMPTAAVPEPQKETTGGAGLTVVVQQPAAQPAASGIPPAQLEREMTRDDGIGKIVDKALGKVQTAAVDKAIEMMMEADYKVKQEIIGNLKPSEREIQMRDDAKKRAEKKELEIQFEEAREKLKAEMERPLSDQMV